MMKQTILQIQHAMNAMLIQIQFADAKAAALMTLSGLLALNGPVTIATAGQASVLQLASFVCIAACLGGCILTIIPRFPKEEIRRKLYDVDRYSWPGLVDSSRDPSEYPEFMRKAEASQLVLSLARANQATAKVLHRKFSVMRVTFGVGAFGLSLLGLNGLLSLMG